MKAPKPIEKRNPIFGSLKFADKSNERFESSNLFNLSRSIIKDELGKKLPFFKINISTFC
jgi:hypothetical protein